MLLLYTPAYLILIAAPIIAPTYAVPLAGLNSHDGMRRYRADTNTSKSFKSSVPFLGPLTTATDTIEIAYIVNASRRDIDP